MNDFCVKPWNVSGTPQQLLWDFSGTSLELLIRQPWGGRTRMRTPPVSRHGSLGLIFEKGCASASRVERSRALHTNIRRIAAIHVSVC